MNVDVCSDDVLKCPDGSFVRPDPANNCGFLTCPSVVAACTDDVFKCPHGSFVGRNIFNNCEFLPCPEEVSKTLDFQDPCPDCPERKKINVDVCTDNFMKCSDGSFVHRDPSNDCDFFPFPAVVAACTDDVFECSDGSSVGRDLMNNCEFLACPEGEDI